MNMFDFFKIHKCTDTNRFSYFSCNSDNVFDFDMND